MRTYREDELFEENKRLREALADALMAILWTRDYVGENHLPALQGWSWYDEALKISEIIPDSDAVGQFKLRCKHSRYETSPDVRKD